MLRLLGSAALVAICLALRESHHLVHLSTDGKTISQDIIHDVEENTVLVTIGDVSDYERTFPTVNFHDFDTGYVAFKDIKQRMCSLSRVPIPNASPEIYRMGVTNLTYEYTGTYQPTPLTYSDVNEVAGSRIADFCKNYVTYMRVLTRQTRNKRGVENKDDDGKDNDSYMEGSAKMSCWDDPVSCGYRDHNCVICVVHSDLAEYQSLSQRVVG